MFWMLLFFLFISGAIALASFLLFIRARMAGNEKKENFFRSLHFASLAIFTILGVWELIVLSDSGNYG